jgi:hypothetical protein
MLVTPSDREIQQDVPLQATARNQPEMRESFPDNSLMAIQGSRKTRMIAILVTAMPV